MSKSYKTLNARLVQLQQEMAKVKASLSLHREYVELEVNKAIDKMRNRYFICSANRNILYTVTDASFSFEKTIVISFVVKLKRTVYDLEKGTTVNDTVERKMAGTFPSNVFNFLTNGDLITCDTNFIKEINEAKKRNLKEKIAEIKNLQASLEKELESLK